MFYLEPLRKEINYGDQAKELIEKLQGKQKKEKEEEGDFAFYLGKPYHIANLLVEKKNSTNSNLTHLTHSNYAAASPTELYHYSHVSLIGKCE